jgi:hypothetical protein
MIRTLPISKPSSDPKTGRGPTLPERAAAAQKKSLAQREAPPVTLKPAPWVSKSNGAQPEGMKHDTDS